MRIPSLSRDAAYIIAALALLLLTFGVVAQPIAGSTAPETPPGPKIIAPEPGAGRVGTAAVDCTRAGHKSRAECRQGNPDSGTVLHTGPSGVPGSQTSVARANGGMNAGPR